MTDTQTSTRTAEQAIRFAITIDDHHDRLAFLEAWVEQDLSEWPEFTDAE